MLVDLVTEGDGAVHGVILVRDGSVGSGSVCVPVVALEMTGGIGSL